MENQEIIYGRNPVAALIDTNRRRINKIYVAAGIKYDDKIRQILSRAKECKINVQEVPRNKLDKLAGGVHQGIAASVSPIEYTDLDELLRRLSDKSNSLLIILDRVEDPHNFGSIIRTAAAAGADGIIIAKRRSSPVTATVEKASAGTVELLPIVQVSNIASTLEKLKKNNFWIVGAEAAGEKYYFDVDYDMNCALVLGGEGFGISDIVKKECDILTNIPMESSVNSLNVANAASILIYEVVRQRILKHRN
ncbi:MAG: 23S rRNA (guanosine(2251)-2'-O)-methyltransferase RlmB [Candidatus Gastranaerophilales bacterium]|nr:23S rRNA (guanosine(2251)-2'-O)-methyltransferase RlmB [Candidatus Gastranaerophilales bacterium]